MRRVLGFLALALTAQAAPKKTAYPRFTLSIPSGYEDVSASLRLRGLAEGNVALKKDNQTTIVLQKAPIAGGTGGDPERCSRTAKNLADGLNGKVEAAAVIETSAGKSCQMKLTAQKGVALITELNRANETWLMTCNFSVGDRVAERVCRATLASFKFAK